MTFKFRRPNDLVILDKLAEIFKSIFGLKDFDLVPGVRYVLEQICKQYSNRKGYHGLNHIYQMLRGLEQIKGWCQNWKLVAFAIMMHDFVYVPGNRDNEANSAKEARHFWEDCCQILVGHGLMEKSLSIWRLAILHMTFMRSLNKAIIHIAKMQGLCRT